ncbi:CDP-6-deoxy-delta-3,4-glucoseen reductase [Parvibium lacunae]|uniref:CDP-6-deoxy-delta-3,4-glucoseen reductase n=1 Tax=Parvibium lacunae TaxID=1888893 RepID=A0A368L690_9BURK|nr:CDP-6-deoxy-delta-3,4-glucoseen reductase [Parvibium lacunae]RCS59190.1 CDP-6-deoxy-delta-3,4-glucoseen reductase [Parvibium lacunae]
MSFTVTVQPSGVTFAVNPNEKILEAALRQSVGLPYGCKDGACGSCKGKVLSGAVAHGPHQDKALSSAEATQGYALFCCATTTADLEIECRTVTGMGDIPVKKLPCRVASLEKPTSDVAILKLQLPANERLQYLAGQYVEILLRDGKRRSYSMASAPHQEGPVELHIRHMPGGVFTDQVFSTLKERDILRFEGPFGTFFLREDSEKPIVLLASGTGFAPIKAIIEHAIHKNITRPMTLYWGARKKADIYQWELVQQWAENLPNFKFIPVLSEALAEDAWTGRTGLVHQAVMADLPDLSQYQVYACGAPIMVESAQRDFSAQCGLPTDEFYADSFTSEADKQSQTV